MPLTILLAYADLAARTFLADNLTADGYELLVAETAADALAQLAEEAGISLIHLAIAFVLRHPAVTAAIIGPRTMEQLESQLGAVELRLDAEVLDRIDGIVPPGRTTRASSLSVAAGSST